MSEPEEITTEDMDKVTVAALATQLIGKLHLLLAETLGDDYPRSLYNETQCAVAFFTSVMDGKCESPQFIGDGFANACEAVDQAIMDEMSRCQVMLHEQVERAVKAESSELIHKQYASWYLRLRDGEAGDLVIHDISTDGYFEIQGEELDQRFEDLDGEVEDGIDVPGVG